MLTMASALDRCRRLYAERPAIVDYEGTWTWAEHIDRVARIAGAIRSMGVEPGQRIGILCRNTFRHCEILHAGYWSGVVVVPVNVRLAPPEIAFILNDADVQAVAVEDVFLDLLETQDLAQYKANAFCIAPKPLGGELPDYEDLIAQTEPLPVAEIDENDDATLLYTGGTTGRSKGVRLSHYNVVVNGMQCGAEMGFKGDSIYLHIAPMFHAADLLSTGYTLVGAAHAYLTAFEPAVLLRTIADLKVTDTMLAPTMIIMTLQEENPADYDLSSLKWFLYGSAPMAAEWIVKTFEAFPGVTMEQGYGLTETSPILTYMNIGEHEKAIASGDITRLKAAGRPVIGVDMRIVDENDVEVPTGEPGEVIVRAPNVTKGYLNLPEVNEEVFRGGWFHTGDVGRMDEEGFMYLLDRKKDMIITGGENVYTSEVEGALYQHSAVAECAVVGVPDEKYGEALFAAIVPQPGTAITAEELIAHCRERIAGYKIPRLMVILDELPKTAVGKVRKNEIRRIYSNPANRP